MPSVQDCHNETLKNVCLLIHYYISTVLILQRLLELFVLSLPCIACTLLSLLLLLLESQWNFQTDLSKTKVIWYKLKKKGKRKVGCSKHANLLHHVLHTRAKTQEGEMGKIHSLIFNYGFSKTEKHSKDDLGNCF